LGSLGAAETRIWNSLNVFLNVLAVLASSGFIGIQRAPGNGTPLFQIAINSFNSVPPSLQPTSAPSKPTASPSPLPTTVSSSPSPLPSATPARSASSSSTVFVALLSDADDIGVKVARAQFARIAPNDSNNTVHLFLSVTSSKSAWKIFAPVDMLNLIGWSLTTEGGKRCRIQSNLDGVRTFDEKEYQRYMDDMQILSPTTPQQLNITGNCNQPVVLNDRFALTGEFWLLPSTAAPGNRESMHRHSVHFNSSGFIPLE
jgi:hypothetical protein